ncbi:glutamine synthetase family protein [Sulfobacillus harzensis]|uniref:Glutamine synthetase n=1 Tax=Sulfobacillus harzensis TaxID=2729629 RepID=A0A7Y0L344_9FIRM|nr:glutamine synthetase family protein [Sulfobacillus harzensis]NMP22102.1 glutamine synthetase [Sulfobacillus harzensis]
MTKDEVLEQARALHVDVVRLQFTDILGIVKNVDIPVKSLGMALDGRMMFDGSSIEGFVRIEESDMYLLPDPSTFAVLPGRAQAGVTARLMCDIVNPDGSPFAGCPRSALKRVLAEARDLGFSITVAPEPEFFLFEGTEARTTDEAGYFDLSPSDLGEDARRDIVLAMESMGYAIEATHHEVSPGQHEIDFPYTDPLYCADTLMTFRVVARLVARQHGFHATFMPKPLAGVNGSGLHLHQRLMSDQGNVFYDAKQPNGVSRTALRYISGLMAHARAFTAITNPLINSYKRLVPGYEAPVYIAWSMGNRSPMVRVPRGRGMETAIEVRSPDPSCNPYLGLAATIKSGLDGLKHRYELSAPISRNIYRMNDAERRELGIERLPEDLEEALDALEGDRVVWDALGDHIAQRFIEAKRLEWDVYRHEVHQWELDQYLRMY